VKKIKSSDNLDALSDDESNGVKKQESGVAKKKKTIKFK
jgi:hypothetical protein